MKKFIMEKIVIKNLKKLLKISERNLRNQPKIGFCLETIKRIL